MFYLSRKYIPYRPTIKYHAMWFTFWLVFFFVCCGLTSLCIIPLRLFDISLWWLCAAAPVLILSFCFFIRSACTNFIKPLFYIHKCFEYEADCCDDSIRAVSVDGGPGAGKTFSTTHRAVVLSQYVAFEAQKDFLLQLGRLENTEAPAFANSDDEELFNSFADTMMFYNSNPQFIPFLVSNYPIKVGGQYSYQLTLEHLTQQDALPQNAVIVLDESAGIISNQRSLNRDKVVVLSNELINDFLSKIRHYGNWYVLTTEQDNAENYIGLRRVAALNRYIMSNRIECQPNWLIRRYNRVVRRIMRRGPSAERSAKADDLKARISKIGFRVFQFRDYGFSEKGKETLGEGTFCFCVNTDFHYATRAYQKQYAARGKQLSSQTYTSLYLPDDGELKQKTAQLYESTEACDLDAEYDYWKACEKADKIEAWRHKYPDRAREYDERRTNESSQAFGPAAPSGGSPNA